MGMLWNKKVLNIYKVLLPITRSRKNMNKETFEVMEFSLFHTDKFILFISMTLCI